MSYLKHNPIFMECLDAINHRQSVTMHGLIPEAQPIWIASAFRETKKSFLILTSTEKEAKQLAENLNSLLEKRVYYYPENSLSYYNIRSLEDENRNSRIKALMSIVDRKPRIVVASISALHQKISTPKAFLKECIHINLEDEINPEDLARQLIFLRYRRVNMVEAVGEFSLRGGILDVYPAQGSYPIRIEFFDQEIDSIRSFQIEDQRSVEILQDVIVGPAMELILSKKEWHQVAEGIEKELSSLAIKTKKNIDRNHLQLKYNEILEYLNQGHFIENTDLLVPYLQRESYGNLLSYFGDDDVVVTLDITELYEKTEDWENAFREDLTYQMEKGEVFPKHRNMAYSSEEIFESLLGRPLINTNLLLRAFRNFNPEKLLHFQGMEAESFHRQFSLLFERLRELMDQGYAVQIFAGERRKANNLYNVLQEHGFRVLWKELKAKHIGVFEKYLSGGVLFPQGFYAIFTQREIYGERSRRGKIKGKKKDIILRADDLSPGDYVVHENHGIGRFERLVTEEREGTLRDYLLIAYAGGDKLYIPTDQMNLVQKYIGTGSDRRPKLSRLGTEEWSRTKHRAKKALEEIAEDLVELYAKREKVKGFAFAPDEPWQREFEESFPYEETPSQLQSVREIKADMESEKPMDRVLCGDVGYGKTEVALRAAFKAILNGKQVAFLVPTTILAQQHYHTAINRFSAYPLEVEVLSRFKKPSEQKEIIKKLRLGQTDLVIGTHRILSEDIQFADLGLLIVDEEQRFGVRHKEKIKTLQENVDVLTLSATPIPRTLQMGLVGIRDMSYLTESPGGRYPITTYVMPFHPGVISQAIRRELDRKGQVFFVYNNVACMNQMKEALQNMVPDARIGVAHGQMPERQLENMMMQFLKEEVDILLCSTIIETGMDIKNVNTMIIYDADRMGLSQLYQLKGRIGRGNRMGYAYFTYPEDKVLTEIAQKRLLAIRDFTSFGSGFKIAMRDLELRGAGNMLGESQSGHIESIGYDLYVKYLEQALNRVKGKDVKSDAEEFVVDLSVDAYIPREYIGDMSLKLEMYKKIADLESEEQMDALYEEMTDRFSDVPLPVVKLMQVSLLKVLGSRVGFNGVRQQGHQLIFFLKNRNEISPELIHRLSQVFGDEIAVQLSSRPSIRIIWRKNILQEAEKFLKLVRKIKSDIMNKNSKEE